jgi:hypothetical protein
MPSPRSLIVVNLPSLERQSWHEVAPNYIGYVQTVEHSRKSPLLHQKNNEELSTFWNKQFT